MRTIDLHAHLAPRDVLKRMGMLRTAGTDVEVRIGDTWQALPQALVDPDALFAGPEAEGITTRVVSLPPFLLRHDLAADDGPVYSRAMNDGLAALARPSEGRIRVLATVPLQAPEPAIDELRRAVEMLGCDGAEITSNVAGRMDLDDRRLEPFWETAAALRAVILIHPHDVAGAGRMQAYHLRNLVGNPMETTLAASRLIFGGVLVRHPALRIVLSHGGGALPWLLGRLDRAFQVRAECRGAVTTPSEAASRFFYDTVVHSADVLRTLVARMGPSQVVLGTDFPFDMGDPHAVASVETAVEDPEVRQAILAGNAGRLLGSARHLA